MVDAERTRAGVAQDDRECVRDVPRSRTAKDRSKPSAKTKLDRRFAARVIVDAATFGDRVAATKHGISARSVRRYRSMLEKDPELATFVQKIAQRHRAVVVSPGRQELLRKIVTKLESLSSRAPRTSRAKGAA